MIVRYSEGFRRMGSLEETFACTELELRALKAWDRYEHGEALGKHSDIVGTFSDETLRVLVDGTELDDNAEFIERAIGYGLVGGCPYASNIADHISNWPDAIERFTSAGITGEDLDALVETWRIYLGGDDDA